MKANKVSFLQSRFRVLVFFLCLVVLAVIARMVYLTVIDRSFLVKQADERILRTVTIPAYRGMILTANGSPLAVSIPMDTIWLNPQSFPDKVGPVAKVSHILTIPPSRIRRLLQQNQDKLFVYLVRDIKESKGEQLEKLKLKGLHIERTYQRYYPEGAIASQVVGYTNIDDQGQAGLELAYNNWLRGVPGKREVVKDRLGQIVAVVDTERPAKSGRNLVLSINKRIQFLAYRTLRETIKKYHAGSGSVVVLNPNNGEIIAMVNEPTFNPNKPYGPPYDRYRNRAVTDTFEPGSTMKAFSIANALESGHFTPTTKLNTSPGWFMIGRNEVRDELDNGVITVTQVLQKSSNVGVAKMTLSLPPQNLLSLLQRVGFGRRTASGFPGESPGFLPYREHWQPFDLATLAFGYGISITPLQLAHAYTVIASGGKLCPVTFVKRDKPIQCPQVMNAKIAHEMLVMLESVVQPGGTGTRAVIPAYRVAGKTGTAYIAGPHGYNKKHHMASFVGIAPVSNPKLVVAVVIRDPHNHHMDFGGVVAAPAFATIMSGALRILDVPPDKLPSKKLFHTVTPFLVGDG